MSKPELFVGIDVAQPHLDVAVAGEDAVWRVSYDAAGLTELCVRLATAAPAQVVLEATGGLETEVAVALSAAGHAVVVANPRQVLSRGSARKARPVPTHRSRLHSPWSQSTCTGTVAGTAGANWRSMRQKWSIQDSCACAPTMCQATGMACWR